MSLDLTAIAETLGSPVRSATPLAGGDISGATRMTLEDGRDIVAKASPLVDVEACMLRAIAGTGAPSPAVLAEGDGWFAMEWIEARGDARWDALTETLRVLHRPVNQACGWDEDYAFGPVTMPNAPCTDWAQFWTERRLLCHLPHIEPAIGRRIERLCSRIDELLPGNPLISLLHGDLWGGNIIWSGAQAILIDPASYYGHREVDIAMLTLFDHPPDSFFEAQDLESGWSERQPLYRLWPWLVHLRLFGGSYRGTVERELAALGF